MIKEVTIFYNELGKCYWQCINILVSGHKLNEMFVTPTNGVCEVLVHENVDQAKEEHDSGLDISEAELENHSDEDEELIDIMQNRLQGKCLKQSNSCEVGTDDVKEADNESESSDSENEKEAGITSDNDSDYETEVEDDTFNVKKLRGKTATKGFRFKMPLEKKAFTFN